MRANWSTVAALAWALLLSPATAAELEAVEAWGKSRLESAVQDAEPVVERWGYPAVWVVMVIITLVIFTWFRKRGWLKL